jgi:hypothetical protein
LGRFLSQFRLYELQWAELVHALLANDLVDAMSIVTLPVVPASLQMA